MSVVKIRRLQQFNELVNECERARRDLNSAFSERIARDLHQDGYEESCSRCTLAGCCYQSVSVTIFEALPVARRLQREGKSTVVFRARLREIGEEMESMNKTAWFDLIRPCVFLTPEKRCSIYEDRPLACSTHLVITPPENCSPPSFPEKLIGRANNDEISERAMLLSTALQQDLGVPADPILMGSLPKMVAVCLEAMTLPWDQFIAYIEKHCALTPEILAKMVTMEDVIEHMSKKVFKKEDQADVQSNLPGESKAGDGEPGAGGKG